MEEHLTEEEDNEINKELLNTIKIPRDFKLLQAKLPKSQYEDEKLEELDGVGDLSFEENRYKVPKQYISSIPSIIESNSENDLESIPAIKQDTSLLEDIKSKNGLENDEEKSVRKKRKNPKTTPMNLELIGSNAKKFQMYKNMNNQGKKINPERMVPNNNYKNIHEKYLKRAKEIEEQEKQIK